MGERGESPSLEHNITRLLTKVNESIGIFRTVFYRNWNCKTDYLFHKEERIRNMPKGKPTKQTIATEKYAKKVGLMSKSYKLKRETVEAFAEACEKAGVSQSNQLTIMMKEFINEVNHE
jgi:hypothetical protein